MKLIKCLSRARITGEKEPEFLGENVIRPNRVPRTARHLLVIVSRWRDFSKIHFQKRLNFIVVVKDHPPVSGDTEVLE